MNLQTALDIVDELTQSHSSHGPYNHVESSCTLPSQLSNIFLDSDLQPLFHYLKRRIEQGGGEACIELGIQGNSHSKEFVNVKKRMEIH